MKDSIEEDHGLKEKPNYIALKRYVIEAWEAVLESYLQDLLSTMQARC